MDDNAVNRKYARALLRASHLSITEVEDGEKAIEAFSKEGFDLILMDIQMPGMDGFECLRRIREEFPDAYCPVLAVTAFSNDHERSEFSQAGFQALVPKPIIPAELKAEVDKWLNLEHTDQQENSPGSTTLELIDLSVYDSLKRHIRSDTVIDIYEEFESETRGFMDQLKFLVPAKNYPEILSILHTIKGNAGSLGIKILEDHTRQMEGKMRGKIFEDVTKDFDLLQKHFSDFVNNYKLLLT